MAMCMHYLIEQLDFISFIYKRYAYSYQLWKNFVI